MAGSPPCAIPGTGLPRATPKATCGPGWEGTGDRLGLRPSSSCPMSLQLEGPGDSGSHLSHGDVLMWAPPSLSHRHCLGRPCPRTSRLKGEMGTMVTTPVVSDHQTLRSPPPGAALCKVLDGGPRAQGTDPPLSTPAATPAGPPGVGISPLWVRNLCVGHPCGRRVVIGPFAGLTAPLPQPPVTRPSLALPTCSGTGKSGGRQSKVGVCISGGEGGRCGLPSLPLSGPGSVWGPKGMLGVPAGPRQASAL